jgi:hypothetical protein
MFGSVCRLVGEGTVAGVLQVLMKRSEEKERQEDKLPPPSTLPGHTTYLYYL